MASPTPADHILADIIAAFMACLAAYGIGYAILRSAKEDREGIVVIEGEGDDEHDEHDETGGDDGGCVADGCGAGPDEGDRS